MSGEEWLVSRPGAYLPGPHEEIIGALSAHKLNNKLALHVVALQTFTDRFGKKRKTGEEWLITEKVLSFWYCMMLKRLQFIDNLPISGAAKLTTGVTLSSCIQFCLQ